MKPTPGTLICDGQSIFLTNEVRNWLDHGMQFSWKEGGARSRPRDPRMIVGHWTGGESSGRTLFRNIRRRKTRDGRGLSVHLYIDYEGVIWQYCDTILSTRHAGKANGRAIGIEKQNRAWDPKKLPKSWAKFERGKLRQTLKGRSVSVLSFTTAQLESWVEVAGALSDFYQIPYHVPANSNGSLLTDQMTRAQWSRFEGTLGHYHLTDTRLDPGIQPLGALVECNWDLVKVA